MKDPYANLTDEEFDRILLELAKEEGVESLMMIPGVYECVREHLNNAILDTWEERQQEHEEEC